MGRPGRLRVVQSAILLGIIHWWCELKGPWAAMYVFVLLNGFIGIGIGLTLSAFAKTSEQAMSSLVPVVLMMVLFGGALIPLNETFKAARYHCQRHVAALVFRGFVDLRSRSGRQGTGSRFSPNFLPDVRRPKQEPKDMAEKLFPKDEMREGPMTAFGALAGMLAVVLLAPGNRSQDARHPLTPSPEARYSEPRGYAFARFDPRGSEYLASGLGTISDPG